MSVEFRVLGPIEMWVAGRRVDLGPMKQRAVLAALLSDVGRVVTPEILIDRVWDDSGPAKVRRSLHSYITRLRGVLAEAGTGTVPGAQPCRIRREPAGYRLEVDPEHVDLARFRGLVGRADLLPPAARLPLLREAIGLWHGEPLAGVPGAWADRTRREWGREHLDALLHWAETEYDAGDTASTIVALTAAATEHPLVEPVVAALMRALYAVGRGPEALERYAVIRQLLADELGTDPGTGLQELHRAILRGEALPAPVHLTARQRPAAEPPIVPAQLPFGVASFTGRHAELAQLDGILSTVGDQPAAVVISAVSGTAGVGKTALAVHWARRIAARFPDGQLYVNLRGFDPTGCVAAPDEAIREFLAALGVPADRVPGIRAARSALYRSLVARRRLLVLLDNARDADQVRPLLPGAPGCLTIVTSRRPLAGLVAAEGARPISLGLLPPGEARNLLISRIGADRIDAESGAVAEILARCAGLPLALAIIGARAAIENAAPLAALAAELRDSADSLDPFTGEDQTTNVRAVFSWSYSALSPAAARLFRLLGLHPGPDLTAPAAASLAALTAGEAHNLLGELAQANLINEASPGRYSLHDLLRVYVAELTNTADQAENRRTAGRRLLDHYLHTAHGADRLIDPAHDAIPLAAPAPGVVPERLDDVGSAMGWFTAEHRALLATLRQAAAGGFHAGTWQLAWALSNYLNRHGHWQDWVDTQQAALLAARQLGDRARQAQSHRLLARAYGQLSQSDLAHAHYLDALTLYRDLGDLAGQAHTHLRLSIMYDAQDRRPDALHHAEQSLALYRAEGQDGGVAYALNMVGWCHVRLGSPQRSLDLCDEALALQQRLADRNGEASTWDTLGCAHYHLGNHSVALTCHRRAVALFQTLGDRYMEADCLVHLGDCQDAGGDTEARATWQQALTILNDLDHHDAAAVRTRLDRADRPLGREAPSVSAR